MKPTAPGPMPYGSGSIQKKRRTWWLIYRNAQGQMIQENSGTTDQLVAHRMLAERALDTAQAKVATLERILDEAQTQITRGGDQRQRPVDGDYQQRRGSRSVRHDAAVGTQGKGTKARKGKR